MVNPNLFASGLDGYNKSYGLAYDRMQTSHDQRARKKTGGYLASGDQQGAAAAAAEGGLLNESRQITRDMQGQEQQTYQRAQAADEQQYSRGQDSKREATQLAIRQADGLEKIASGLIQSIPVDPANPQAGLAARAAAVQKMAPVFQQLQLGDVASQITPDMLTDESLSMIGAQAAAKIKTFLTGGGDIVAVNERALQTDFNGSDPTRVLYTDQTTKDYKRAQTARANRPPAGRSGGGSGGSSGVPSGFVLD